MNVKTGPAVDPTVDHETATALWERWLVMWNGQPEVAHEIIADGLQMWYNGRSAIDASHITDADAMVTWVTRFRTKFDDMVFSTDFGPMVDGEMYSIRWFLNARYNGSSGFPEDVPGEPFTRAGVDIWRVTDGKIAQVWSMSTAA
jgi:hypothetical protein